MKQTTFGPDDEDAFRVRRDELVAEFADWAQQFPLRLDPEDLGMLLDWKWGYGDGRLDRWRKADLHEFLLGWCPRKLAAPPDLAHTIPANVTMAMSFLATRGLQSGDPIEQLTEYALSLQDDFMAKMTDPANFGLGKSIFSELGIDDPTSLDAAGVQQAMETFNALPEDQRRAVTDAALVDPSSDLPTIGPVQLPDDEAVRVSAEGSCVLAGFATLAEYFAAPGKTLTNKGNLRLADARELVERLGTSDLYEQEIGDHVFRKRSATQFTELDHWQWWASESGAIQRRGNKLVGVKAWLQRRRKDPVAEVRRAFDILTDYGPLASYWPRVSPVREMLDESVGPLLGRLLQSHGPVEYDEVLEVWAEMAASIGEPDRYFGSVVNRSFDQLITLLERAGLVIQVGAVRTTVELVGAARSGGTVELTPVGVVIAVDLLRKQGITVELLPDPEKMTAGELASLASDTELEPDEWWDVVVGWLGLQPDATVAVGDLVGELGNRDLLLLMIALEAAPESERDRMSPVLRELAFATDPPPGELGAAAINWLLKHDQVDADDVDPNVLLDSVLVTFGAFAEGGMSIVPELTSEGTDVAEQLEFIAAAGRRLPPRVVPLLKSIGSEHPDKTVAKAARKELFRVRSKLGSRGTTR